MSEAIPLGRFAGFPVKVHWSVVVILWLFTWSLATTLPHTVAGYSHPAYWLVGACGAIVLLDRCWPTNSRMPWWPVARG